jgi:hypothetical protein
MSETSQKWPTWVVVVAVLLLLGPVIWALYIVFNLLTAISVGGLLIIVALIFLFIWLKDRVADAEG